MAKNCKNGPRMPMGLSTKFPRVNQRPQAHGKWYFSEEIKTPQVQLQISNYFLGFFFKAWCLDPKTTAQFEKITETFLVEQKPMKVKQSIIRNLPQWAILKPLHAKEKQSQNCAHERYRCCAWDQG
ncbi:hypothetical protein VP01_362g20 [Puccinia sorghi]|uniref:Uncharacterized protein n=1 Tax=Puccinia sorghi TaxID=27349 RepID=A0A0L6UUS1_9BASI|nr:hypothetical protein VP01_362g20 [Puccinia sorghi]